MITAYYIPSWATDGAFWTYQNHRGEKTLYRFNDDEYGNPQLHSFTDSAGDDAADEAVSDMDAALISVKTAQRGFLAFRGKRHSFEREIVETPFDAKSAFLIKIETSERCGMCRIGRCYYCKGRGVLTREARGECDACNGTGKCQFCQGSGQYSVVDNFWFDTLTGLLLKEEHREIRAGMENEALSYRILVDTNIPALIEERELDPDDADEDAGSDGNEDENWLSRIIDRTVTPTIISSEPGSSDHAEGAAGEGIDHGTDEPSNEGSEAEDRPVVSMRIPVIADARYDVPVEPDDDEDGDDEEGTGLSDDEHSDSAMVESDTADTHMTDLTGHRHGDSFAEELATLENIPHGRRNAAAYDAQSTTDAAPAGTRHQPTGQAPLGMPALTPVSPEERYIETPVDQSPATEDMAGSDYSMCPFCGKDFNFPKTPRFCPFCRERLTVD